MVLVRRSSPLPLVAWWSVSVCGGRSPCQSPNELQQNQAMPTPVVEQEALLEEDRLQDGLHVLSVVLSPCRRHTRHRRRLPPLQTSILIPQTMPTSSTYYPIYQQTQSR